jgi:hypothetical protein
MLAVPSTAASATPCVERTHTAATLPPTGGYLRCYSENKLAVVFVHGIFGDVRESWTSSPGNTYWPTLLMGDSLFDGANVYVHGYRTPKVEPALLVEELGSQLASYITSSNLMTRHDRVVFIAHSMGGLVVRSYLVQSFPPPDKIALIYFYGTPSQGANLAGLAAIFSNNPQFRDLETLLRGNYVDQLASRWLATSSRHDLMYPRRVWSYCGYETKKYKTQMVVEKGSATHLCNAPLKPVEADHLQMVKPSGADSDSHVYLREAFIEATSPKAYALANFGAITVDSKAQPFALDNYTIREVAQLKTFDVKCNKTLNETAMIPFALNADEKLVAAQPFVFSAQNASATNLISETSDGRALRLRMTLTGAPTKWYAPCANGKATIGARYVTTRDIK